MILVNQRTNQTISSAVEVAETRRARRRGLLGRTSMDPAQALILTPCWAIHTAFMRFAIDVAFIDVSGRVVKIVCGLPPWRIAASPRAHAVIEMAAGRLEASDLRVDDAVYLAIRDMKLQRADGVSRLQHRDRRSQMRTGIIPEL